MKKILMVLVGFAISAGHAAVLDLTPFLKDRLEDKGCQSRGMDFDFHQASSRDGELTDQQFKQHVIRSKDISGESATRWDVSYTLKDTTYRGIPVKSMQFVIGKSYDASQRIVLDLRKAADKQKFNHIKFNQSKQSDMAPQIEKTAHSAEIYCYLGNRFGMDEM